MAGHGDRAEEDHERNDTESARNRRRPVGGPGRSSRPHDRDTTGYASGGWLIDPRGYPPFPRMPARATRSAEIGIFAWRDRANGRESVYNPDQNSATKYGDIIYPASRKSCCLSRGTPSILIASASRASRSASRSLTHCHPQRHSPFIPATSLFPLLAASRFLAALQCRALSVAACARRVAASRPLRARRPAAGVPTRVCAGSCVSGARSIWKIREYDARYVGIFTARDISVTRMCMPRRCAAISTNIRRIFHGGD